MCHCTYYMRWRLQGAATYIHIIYTSNKNIHFEIILDVGIGEKRKETRFVILKNL